MIGSPPGRIDDDRIIADVGGDAHVLEEPAPDAPAGEGLHIGSSRGRRPESLKRSSDGAAISAPTRALVGAGAGGGARGALMRHVELPVPNESSRDCAVATREQPDCRRFGGGAGPPDENVVEDLATS